MPRPIKLADLNHLNLFSLPCKGTVTHAKHVKKNIDLNIKMCNLIVALAGVDTKQNARPSVMEKEIPAALIRKPADKPAPVGIRPESRIVPNKRGKLDTPLNGKRRNKAVDKRNLLNEKRQYLNMQYKLTRQLLKTASPSKAIIEKARRLGRLVKSSNEEMNELELIADRDIPIALFDKQPDNPIPLKFGPERRFGPVDRREYNYHISKERRNEETDRRSLLNYKRQYLSLQYRITQQLLKAVSPSKKIIEHACKIGRIIKISEEELTKLQLILKPSR